MHKAAPQATGRAATYWGWQPPRRSGREHPPRPDHRDRLCCLQLPPRSRLPTGAQLVRRRSDHGRSQTKVVQRAGLTPDPSTPPTRTLNQHRLPPPAFIRRVSTQPVPGLRGPYHAPRGSAPCGARFTPPPSRQARRRHAHVPRFLAATPGARVPTAPPLWHSWRVQLMRGITTNSGGGKQRSVLCVQAPTQLIEPDQRTRCSASAPQGEGHDGRPG